MEFEFVGIDKLDEVAPLGVGEEEERRLLVKEHSSRYDLRAGDWFDQESDVSSDGVMTKKRDVEGQSGVGLGTSAVPFTREEALDLAGETLLSRCPPRREAVKEFLLVAQMLVAQMLVAQMLVAQMLVAEMLVAQIDL